MIRIFLALNLLFCASTFSQSISGVVKDSDTFQPIAFANVGVRGGNTGTVTDINGEFSIHMNHENADDTLMISIIGYEPVRISVAEFNSAGPEVCYMKEKVYDLAEVIAKPIEYRERMLGVTTGFKKISAGFADNLLGYEMGILMKVKKSAKIKKVNLNIAHCTYDTIFYRINIYKVNGKMNFENLLHEPIYIEMPKSMVENEVQIDLQTKNIRVQGDFLVTLEHVKDLGEGQLLFCSGLLDKTFYRKTSQGTWETAPVSISISVLADVEK